MLCNESVCLSVDMSVSLGVWPYVHGCSHRLRARTSVLRLPYYTTRKEVESVLHGYGPIGMKSASIRPLELTFVEVV